MLLKIDYDPAIQQSYSQNYLLTALPLKTWFTRKVLGYEAYLISDEDFHWRIQLINYVLKNPRISEYFWWETKEEDRRYALIQSLKRDIFQVVDT
jgi:hypothetical protein